MLRFTARSGFIAATLFFAVQASAQTPAPAPDSARHIDVISTPPSSAADHDARAPKAIASRLSGGVSVDGKLTEEIWRTAPAVTEFYQRQPKEGARASLRTEVRVVYDDEALYVGARMFDDQPAKIVGNLTRRDGDTGGSDNIFIQFDPYHNHNGDASFSLNPVGTKWDGGNGDESWDPVWEGKTHVDSLGWTAEMRIPFSQLRFRPGSSEPWGFQIERFINRLNETDTWSFWLQNEQGGPARWGHITGIASPSKVPGRLELLPYVVSLAKVHSDIDVSDPFASKREGTVRAGADVKYQVTSTLTLSATLNPDFGQAEVDPAVVNLSAFETFFDEKREFFIEGRDKFRFGSLWCFTCSNTSSLGMLFTRRIGRPPQAAGLAFQQGDYVDAPDQSTILGAAKLTGRTKAGWNIGVLNAVTAREVADIRKGITELRQEVEPTTNYFVSRLSRDMKSGNLRVGGIATSVMRKFDDPALENLLNKHSEGLGGDVEYWWKNRTFHFIGQTAMTNISGDPDAVLRAQRSSARYFQRPDRENGSNGLFSDKYDPAATSMRGYGTYVRMAKEGGSFRWESSLNVRSPGFENNDIAALSRTDYIWMHGNINKRWTKPTKYYRYAQYTFGAQQQYNYDGDLTARQVHLSAYTETPFYWGLSFWGALKPEVMDDRKTRGGPVVALPSEQDMEINFNTDQRKKVYFEVGQHFYHTAEGGISRATSVEMTAKPASNVSVTIGPSYGVDHGKAQYISAITDATAANFYGKRYVFSSLDAKSLSMDTRLNITFTPAMSLQLFAQPFISSNKFSEYKQYAQPRAVAKQVYGRDVGTIAEKLNANRKTFVIDPDGSGPAASFEVADPSFTFRSLRGNAVFRWEYVPGSTLYLVWTQDRSSDIANGDLDFSRDRRALLDSPSNHVFLVKVNYWLPL